MARGIFKKHVWVVTVRLELRLYGGPYLLPAIGRAGACTAIQIARIASAAAAVVSGLIDKETHKGLIARRVTQITGIVNVVRYYSVIDIRLNLIFYALVLVRVSSYAIGRELKG
jgi:hypothetical protein